MMKNVKALGVLLCTLVLGTTAAHAESGWSGEQQISQIEVVDTYAWVKFDGWSGAYNLSSEGCTSTYGFIVDNDTGGFENQYRTLMSAYLAGRSVNVKVERDGSACRITRIRVQ
ncbi:MAG: hypothetical protein SangKO_003760 [Sandaracinaceae bacterium]